MTLRKANVRYLLLFIIIALFVDQVSKILVTNVLVPFAQPTKVIGDILRLKLTFNPYGVFGISFGSSVLYYIVSFVGIVVLIYVALSVSNRTNLIILGLIIGGALGNIIDRIRLNYVIDFIDMGVGNFRWFTYNFADAFITVGAVYLLIKESFGKKDGVNSDSK